MMGAVLMRRSDGIRRQWFGDARDDGRRMEVSWHPDEGIVIISLWHGSMCRATFRLPVDQAPALIQTLADALGDAVQSEPTSAQRRGRGRPSSLLAMGREQLKKHVAEIVALEGRSRP
jgi:hypothetical protein